MPSSLRRPRWRRQGRFDLIEGPANYRSTQPPLGQALDVVQSRDPAGGDHRHFDGFGQLGRCFDVWPLEHAVAADVGINDRRDRPTGNLPGQFDRGDVGGLPPALNRDAPVTSIDTERYPARKSPAHALGPGRVAGHLSPE